ncbi:chaperone protein DnaK [Streptomyces lincolnensis]|uniref:Chaperone protein DnaK n=1 Tax=Streptomyces lincolnensis TaxID=1915 RepID=A0A1B1M331_STRLN|nr:Hsp70 family protein [Streptomyces lincolnensis]ANS63056.1 chaperone protein DnaK [Streptomyces lincolnensis]AXG51980.1 chaperone protein DnaK [Streptomyces lincolnensis]QMV04977.1 Hsp70 family protein [Streptomyces lincolnensis]
MEDELHRVVGIDLGTTYSAVSAYDPEDFAPKILADPAREGAAAVAMPSVIRLAATGTLTVGHDAKDAIGDGTAAADTLVEIKREMGAVFTPELLDHFGARGRYVEDDPVRARLGDEWLRPQEISALVLMKMKRIAEQSLGGEIHDAVVTVPAYFMERQKKATEEAALLAGLYPRQLIPEPTAAAIAYGVDRAESERQIYLVFDLGGGTFDVSIIETRDDEIEVIATAGDQRLGGGDFDDAVAAWIVRELGEALPAGFDRLRLKAAAEAAKRELSLRGTTTVDIGDGLPTLELDRAGFEGLIRPILDRSLHQVDEALRFAKEAKGVAPEDVNAVLLVGGSTRIPQVRQMLLDHFDQDEGFVRGDANPDTLVARGAAIVANRFEASPAFDLATRPTAERSADEQDYTVTLITEHTLGVGVQQGLFNPLIERGTKIPARKVQTYTNPDQADRIEAAIYQGEDKYIFENTLIGTIHLDDIEPRPGGYHRFEVEFSLDVNGLLGVQVTHTNTGREYQATFDQSTTIGKVDELAQRRAALLGLFETEGRVDTVRSAAPAERFTVPEPVTPMPETASIPDPVTIPDPVSVPDPIPAPVPAPAAVTVPAPASPEIDPAEVPAEYRRMVKKALRAARNGDAPAPLGDALRAFMDAVRAEADEDTLDELADLLEDAYDDSRR